MAEHDESQYVPIVDPKVKANLEKWQDLKFGLFMHWGPYSQWGVVESWSICNEDWIERRKGRYENYAHYKEDYRNLQKTFDPRGFDPAKWVKAAREAGMGYVVFTTKHHDGFCMFDTRLTDYKITSPNCPFHSHPRSNITKEIFDAFRKEGFLIGAYFSKPDWDSEYYWWPYRATPDRHVNYDPAKHPDRWQKFKDYTYNQIEQLMTGYGRVDILWFDGAWVRPLENMPEKFESWAKKKNWNQDIGMARIAAMARNHQPGLIVVDRWVSGEHENYLTPEQRIPETPISVPWESCITMAAGWSYNENHTYKPVRQLVHMLVEIVSKGGNFLLNIGPSPEGDWAEEAYARLEGIAAWMKMNGEAIHATRPVSPFKEDNICFTQKKDGSAIYAVYLAGEEEKTLPQSIEVNSLDPADGACLTLLGAEGELAWKRRGNGFSVEIPEDVRKNPPCEHAWVLKIYPP
jgi:alpha-L-fucosidase